MLGCLQREYLAKSPYISNNSLNYPAEIHCQMYSEHIIIGY